MTSTSSSAPLLGERVGEVLSRLAVIGLFVCLSLPSLCLASSCEVALRFCLGQTTQFSALLYRAENALDPKTPLDVSASPAFLPSLLLEKANSPSTRQALLEAIEKLSFSDPDAKSSKLRKRVAQAAEIPLVANYAKNQLTELEKFLAFEARAKVAGNKRFRNIMRSVRVLPKSLSRIKAVIDRWYTFEELDAALWSLVGFHTMSQTDKFYRQRPWDKASPSSITPEEVDGITVDEFASTAWFAMEIESPIIQYSLETGEGIRFLNDRVARWFGQNEEQATFARIHKRPFCAGPWCLEEQRHTPAFSKIVKRLLGFTPPLDNVSETVAGVGLHLDDRQAGDHMVERENTEWNASSTYAFLVGHSNGNLNQFVTNILRDEIKHLAILSAADRYLFGPRPWGRFFALMRAAIAQLKYHGSHRSTADVIQANPMLVGEVLAAHLMAEAKMRKWLSSLPLYTLTAIFETDSNLYELPEFQPSRKRHTEIAKQLKEGERKRLSLERWHPKARREALKQREFEQTHRARIDQIIEEHLGGFEGGEVPGSPQAMVFQDKITKLRRKDFSTDEFTRSEWNRLINTLTQRLRDHQIRNNWYIRTRSEKESVRLAAPPQKTGTE